LVLKVSGVRVDLREPLLITGCIEQYSLVQILLQQTVEFGRIVGRQQISSDILGTNCIGLLLLVVLALVARWDPLVLGSTKYQLGFILQAGSLIAPPALSAFHP
jgi:hypothetical protein